VRARESGLTLVEVMVTIAILGVMLMVALPGMGDFFDNMQANSDTNDLFSSLLLARSEAVTRNSAITICKIDPAAPVTCANGETWNSGWISFEDLDRDGVVDPGEEILDTYTGMGDRTAVTAVNYTNIVRYLPSGSVTTNGAFNICVNSLVAQNIIVNATGRPRMADAACP